VAERAAARRLGVFYTPDRLAVALTRWALQDGATRVLDPSCGDGRFVLAAASELAASHGSVVGIDVDSDAVEALRRQRLAGVELRCKSFFDEPSGSHGAPPFGAVVGNPPYIRHHWQAEGVREQARERVAEAGVRLSKQADLWASFVVHAAQHVALDGRMALVLPVSATHADYASDVWAFLKRSFGTLELLVLQHRAFEHTHEQVVLLLASRRGGSTLTVQTAIVHTVGETEARLAVADLDRQPMEELPEGIPGWKWGLLPAATRQLWAEICCAKPVRRLDRCATVRIGTVTGANGFFIRDPNDPILSADGVESRSVISSSRVLTSPVWRRADELSAPGAGRGRLLVLSPALRPSGPLRAMLRDAEARELDQRHHCMLRQPWWSLRDLAAPDAFLGYMGSNPHSLVRNVARTLCTNAVHRIDWTRPPSRQGAVVSSWSSLFRLSAELWGRHYGGGVLKLEPKAAKRLPVVPVAAVGAVLGEMDVAARAEGQTAACGIADRAVADAIGVSVRDLRRLSEGARMLAAARARR
jgi:adenine-specific DNA-methyltransferase